MLDPKITHFTLTLYLRYEPAYYVREQHASLHLASCIEFRKNISQEKIETQLNIWQVFKQFWIIRIEQNWYPIQLRIQKLLKSSRIRLQRAGSGTTLLQSRAPGHRHTIPSDHHQPSCSIQHDMMSDYICKFWVVEVRDVVLLCLFRCIKYFNVHRYQLASIYLSVRG